MILMCGKEFENNKINFDKYLYRNLFEKNEGIMLKYLRRYNRKLFELYIKERKTIISFKSVNNEGSIYNYRLGGD